MVDQPIDPPKTPFSAPSFFAQTGEVSLFEMRPWLARCRIMLVTYTPSGKIDMRPVEIKGDASFEDGKAVLRALAQAKEEDRGPDKRDAWMAEAAKLRIEKGTS